MRVSFIVSAVLLLGALPFARAQAEPWKLGMDASVMLSQSAYTNNWIGGEAGAITWVSNLNSTAEKQIFSKVFNKNTLKLAFGQTHKQDKITKDWSRPEKSTDLIDFESTFRFTLGSFVEPIVAFRALSQFLDYGANMEKKYINPTILTETAGIAKVFIKEEKREFMTRLGAGVRQEIDQKRDPRVEHKAGLELVGDFKTPLLGDRIDYTSKLTVFQGFYYSEADRIKGLPGANDWKSPDVNWENIFTASITKYLMVNLYTQFLYNKQIDKAGRFKETLSLGLTFKLI
ncbi:MAG: DUF3078 domain-containing protein [Chitinivibrionia bacterium]|nr:DUF3078 domain-containing protein [Chitinivibrionia bacterium]